MTAMPQTSLPNFSLARANMVESQLRPNQVTDQRLLEVMGALPREIFVPSSLVGVAYLDESIPLISGRSLLQPMVLARLIQAAEIKPTDRILDLAPATGYSTLVLVSLAGSVVAVEPDALLNKEATNNVAEYASGKVQILAGAPVEGCGSHAPFDVIFINGSIEFLPKILLDQLAEGGRLVAVMRDYGSTPFAHTGQGRLYRKTKGKMSWTSLFDANIPPAPGFTLVRGFEF